MPEGLLRQAGRFVDKPQASKCYCKRATCKSATRSDDYQVFVAGKHRAGSDVQGLPRGIPRRCAAGEQKRVFRKSGVLFVLKVMVAANGCAEPASHVGRLSRHENDVRPIKILFTKRHSASHK
jgi:hypothetical protein